LFADSSKPIQAEAPSPSYHLEPDGEGDPTKGGPDAGDRPVRIIDAEEEQLQRFLNELNRQLPVEKMPHLAGQAVVDFHQNLKKEPPFLTARQKGVIWEIVPLLKESKYRVTLVVWATTPNASAWARAASQAKQVVDEIARTRGLYQTERERLVPMGQPWRYPNVKRPIMSLVISKSEP
jgi:hypothetical protein